MLRRLSIQTSGESHGRGVLAVVTGFPAGVALDLPFVDGMLARRQGGYGRSTRQRLEQDRLDVMTGVLKGATTGAPLTLAVWNKDDRLEDMPPVHRPRPGHADLAGAQKYGTRDMRGVLERASARETAARVAAGGLAASVLGELGILLFSHVVQLGEVQAAAPRSWSDLGALGKRRDASPFYATDRRASSSMKDAVLAARAEGDTLGGVFEVRAFGVPPGLGSLQDWGSRLDARLAAACMSIPAIKAVEIGEGLEAAERPGSEVHDEVGRPGPGGPRRRSNRAGGIEGGMSNGEPLVVRSWMKPIPTLARPLASWDYTADQPSHAHFERSDVTAVPAASVVGEAMVAVVVLDALLEKTGGDTLGEVRAALTRYRKSVARRFGSGGKR